MDDWETDPNSPQNRFARLLHGSMETITDELLETLPDVTLTDEMKEELVANMTKAAWSVLGTAMLAFANGMVWRHG